VLSTKKVAALQLAAERFVPFGRYYVRCSSKLIVHEVNKERTSAKSLRCDRKILLFRELHPTSSEMPLASVSQSGTKGLCRHRTSPNSTLHIKRSSLPPRGADISSMPPRIDSAGTSLMNSMPWHMPMIGRRLIPRISILVHPSVSDRAVVLIHSRVRTCVRATTGADFDSSWEFRASLVADPYATAEGNLHLHG